MITVFLSERTNRNRFRYKMVHENEGVQHQAGGWISYKFVQYLRQFQEKKYLHMSKLEPAAPRNATKFIWLMRRQMPMIRVYSDRRGFYSLDPKHYPIIFEGVEEDAKKVADRTH